MARTMSAEECEQYNRLIDEQTRNITKESAIAFLKKVGYLDENGDVAWPYNANGKHPKRTDKIDE